MTTLTVVVPGHRRASDPRPVPGRDRRRRRRPRTRSSSSTDRASPVGVRRPQPRRRPGAAATCSCSSTPTSRCTPTPSLASASAFAADPRLDRASSAPTTTARAPAARCRRFRNLLHHHVHQTGAGPAETFWTGLGAVRRDAFSAVGGFDEDALPAPVDRGHRARPPAVRAGGRLRLDPTIQGTHLKRWTLRSMLWTDFARRGVPWVALQLRAPGARVHAEPRLAAPAQRLVCVRRARGAARRRARGRRSRSPRGAGRRSTAPSTRCSCGSSAWRTGWRRRRPARAAPPRRPSPPSRPGVVMAAASRPGADRVGRRPRADDRRGGGRRREPDPLRTRAGRAAAAWPSVGYLPALERRARRSARRGRRSRPGSPRALGRVGRARCAAVAGVDELARPGRRPRRRCSSPRRSAAHVADATRGRRRRRAAPWWRSRPRRDGRRRGRPGRRLDPGALGRRSTAASTPAPAAVRGGRSAARFDRPRPRALRYRRRSWARPHRAATMRSLDLGPHLVDWAVWLTGRRGRRRRRCADLEPPTGLALRRGAGRTATPRLDAATDRPHRRAHRRCATSSGRPLARAPHRRASSPAVPVARPASAPRPIGWWPPCRAELEAFAAALRTAPDAPTSARPPTASRAMAVLDAARRQRRDRRPPRRPSPPGGLTPCSPSSSSTPPARRSSIACSPTTAYRSSRPSRERGTRHDLDAPATQFAAGAQHTLYSGVALADHGLFYPFQWSRRGAAGRTTWPTSTPRRRVGAARRRRGRAPSRSTPTRAARPTVTPPGALVCGWQLHDRVVLRKWDSPNGTCTAGCSRPSARPSRSTRCSDATR